MPIALLILLALQQPTAQTPARPPATTQAPARPPATPQAPAQPGATTQAPAQPGTTAPAAAPRRPAPTTATLEVKVIDRSGRPIDDAHVVLQGPTLREEKSDKTGIVTLKTVAPGNYRVRAESTGF